MGQGNKSVHHLCLSLFGELSVIGIIDSDEWIFMES